MSSAICRPDRARRAASCRRNRDYDPTTGTFLTRDPLDGVSGTPTEANPYYYADNDALNRADPLGLRSGDCEMQEHCVYYVNDLWDSLGSGSSSPGRRWADHNPVGDAAGTIGDLAGCAGGLLATIGLSAGASCDIYTIDEMEDQVYGAALASGVDTRWLYALVAAENASGYDSATGSWHAPRSPTTDRVGLALQANSGHMASLGPTAIHQGAFNGATQVCSDLGGMGGWTDLVGGDSYFAAYAGACVFKWYNQIVDGIADEAERNGKLKRIDPSRDPSWQHRINKKKDFVYLRSAVVYRAWWWGDFGSGFSNTRRLLNGDPSFQASYNEAASRLLPFIDQGYGYFCNDGRFACEH